MARVKVLVIRAAGTNCDQETVRAVNMAGAYRTDLAHINELKRNKKSLLKYDLLIIPGGFSYGDYVNAGKILSNEIKFIFQEELKIFLKNGKLIMGICNGFQVLVKSGILSATSEQTYSLIENENKRFECRWIFLKVNKNLFWTKNLPEVITLPVNHGEGRFAVKKQKYLNQLIKGQIAVQYCDQQGKLLKDYPVNPNGSINNIAGIVNKQKQIFGLMPHPERYILPENHPYWNYLKTNNIKNVPFGIQIFKNAIDELKKN